MLIDHDSNILRLMRRDKERYLSRDNRRIIN